MQTKLMFSALLNQLSFATCIVNSEYCIECVNPHFIKRLFDNTLNPVGEDILSLLPDIAPDLKRAIDNALQIHDETSASEANENLAVLPLQWSSEPNNQLDQSRLSLEAIPMHGADGEFNHVCLCLYHHQALHNQEQVCYPVSMQLQTAQAELQQAQNQLLQSEKLASIGQLSAGIAHEINNPIGFITSNMQTLQDYFSKITQFVDQLDHAIDSAASPALIAQRDQLRTTNQLDFVLNDVKEMIDESLEGSDRVRAIIRNLKEFSRVDNAEWAFADLAEGLESTLKMLNNELKYNITLVKQFQSDTPHVYCQPMQLNQVFLNLLLNACQAINEEGVITITLAPYKRDYVRITISDTGQGIPDEAISRIFEPFFTTKPVGSGTGLGLSVSHGIINAHKGTISVESQIGEGTCFTMTLPIQHASTLEAGQLAK